MKTNNPFQIRLHISISCIFIGRFIVFGSIISIQNYNKTSEIILSASHRLFDQINKALQLNFKVIRSSATQAVTMLAYSPLTKAGNLQDRLSYLPMIKTALENEPSLSAIHIAYQNGDFFIVSPIEKSLARQPEHTHEGAAYVVENISVNSQRKRLLTRLFFTRQLTRISQTAAVESQYNPTVMPPYKQALRYEAPVLTDPYSLYLSGRIGSTLTFKVIDSAVVIGADITLEQLSLKLSDFHITSNTEVAMLAPDGKVLAFYNEDQNDDIKHISGNAKLSTIGSDVLDSFSDKLILSSKQIKFDFDNQTWIGDLRKLDVDIGEGIYILMISPESELLAKAINIRDLSLLVSFLIICLTIPVGWLFSRKLSLHMQGLAREAHLISDFDFSSPINTHSRITEVNELSNTMRLMKNTINQFLSLLNSLAGESNFDILLKRINKETMQITQGDGAFTYLYNAKENMLEPSQLFISTKGHIDIKKLPCFSLDEHKDIAAAMKKELSTSITLNVDVPRKLNLLLPLFEVESLYLVALPLKNRHKETIGVLCLLYKEQDQCKNEHLSFVQALSGFAAVSLESKQMLMKQKALMDSFIQLLASAIDSKSPYTGGHCARVPELTRMLTLAACNSTDPVFNNFKLNDEEWEELHIASWLHDCGKVTTPEYIVDKSTKLETIYDRIHEIRMRFEVLKRDAEIKYWSEIAKGGDPITLKSELESQLQALDDDFAFIAECNIGGESLEAENIQRLNAIAEYTWMRTLPDNIGISWEEKQRKQQNIEQVLPVKEKLLDNKPDHIIYRTAADQIPKDNQWGFKLKIPEFKYNRGELYNLSIEKGTLSEEERFKINDHIVQTIIMLDKLPYPKHLENVPMIAGCHHEKMDGTGYPKQLKQSDMPLTARVMAIADIFEALTASDRPYKKAKTLSEAINIMLVMVKDKHIDADLFRLFVTEDVYLEYAKKFLDEEQIDSVEIENIFKTH